MKNYRNGKSIIRSCHFVFGDGSRSGTHWYMLISNLLIEQVGVSKAFESQIFIFFINKKRKKDHEI